MIKKGKNKALVFFSAGVGDSILLVPLINNLKKENYHVTGIFNSPFGCEAIFKNSTLLDCIIAKQNKLSLFIFALTHYQYFDLVFFNHFSFSLNINKLANFIGKNSITNFNDNFLNKTNTRVIKPIMDTHDALQNVLMFNTNATLRELDFNLHYSSTSVQFNLPKDYFIIQISSANNKAPFKNWDIDKWIIFLRYINSTFPNIHLVILGDHTELYFNEMIQNANLLNTISLIGKTNLSQAVDIICLAKLYIGLDSGLMHIAAAFNKPTFTLWGASNNKLYGYEWFGKQHKTVSLNLNCAPCSSWINPNITRVSNPLNCPDFKCIKTISTETVIKEFNEYYKIITNPFPLNSVE